MGVSGLIAVLAFGLTLANFPGIDPRFRAVEEELVSLQSQESLLGFHSELAFLVRTFFFVLIGAIADLRSFRGHALLMAGLIGALFVARWLALQVSRFAFRDVAAKERELMLWIMPRGLITVVLALQVLRVQRSRLPLRAGLRRHPGDERDGSGRELASQPRCRAEFGACANEHSR